MQEIWKSIVPANDLFSFIGRKKDTGAMKSEVRMRRKKKKLKWGEKERGLTIGR